MFFGKTKALLLSVAMLVMPLAEGRAQTFYDEMQVNDDNYAVEHQFAAVGVSRGSSCSPKVSVKYVDKGYVIEHVGNPDNVISHKTRAGKVAGFAQYRGITPSVYVNGFGCNRAISVTITWNAPVAVVMPHKSQVGACRYNRILHHEMEHVRVYLKVPRDFEGQIARIAATSSNPRQALLDLDRSITNEILRRNAEFHAFEARLPTVRGC